MFEKHFNESFFMQMEGIRNNKKNPEASFLCELMRTSLRLSSRMQWCPAAHEQDTFTQGAASQKLKDSSISGGFYPINKPNMNPKIIVRGWWDSVLWNSTPILHGAVDVLYLPLQTFLQPGPEDGLYRLHQRTVSVSGVQLVSANGDTCHPEEILEWGQNL